MIAHDLAAISPIAEAVRLQQFFDSRGWRYCIVGGLATQYWGQPRLTREVQVAMFTGFGRETDFVDALLADYAPRITDAREFALARRVLLLRADSGTEIDVSLAALHFEERMIERSMTVEFSRGVALRICSPEDLIVMKVFAGRESDVRDARSVAVRRRAGPLDWTQIDTDIRELAELKDDPHMLRLLDYLHEAARP